MPPQCAAPASASLRSPSRPAASASWKTSRVQLAGIFGGERPRIGGKAVIVAAADHGVVAQGVTGYPQAVTAQMALNFLAGGAAVSVIARQVGARQIIVDAGIAADMPAASRLAIAAAHRQEERRTSRAAPQCPANKPSRCLLAGVSLAQDAANAGASLIATGDMGIGNTTPSSAITAALTGADPEQTTGAGTGRTPDELRRKTDVVRQALRANAPDASDGLDVLAKVGGFEIGVLAGVILGGAMERRGVVLDGFISGAAALIAHALCPAARDYMIASHRSAERGHIIILEHLGLRPLLDLQMRLGEGSAAVPGNAHHRGGGGNAIRYGDIRRGGRIRPR